MPTTMLSPLLRRIRDRHHPLQRLRRNRILARLLKLIDRPVSRRLSGVPWKVRVRLVRHAAYLVDSRIVEPGELALLAVLCRRYRPQVFWDVGANIGLYSWLVLSADRDARAVLFEPDPDNLALLRRTVRDAGLARAELVPAAAGDADGPARFRRDTQTGHTGAIAEDGTTAVRMVTLDSMLDGRPPPALIKIDVEGGEAAVLAGATRLLADHRPILLIESFGRARDPVAARLGAAGYALASAEDPDGALDAAANMLALPPEKAGDLERLRELWRDELSARRLGRQAAFTSPHTAS